MISLSSHKFNLDLSYVAFLYVREYRMFKNECISFDPNCLWNKVEKESVENNGVPMFQMTQKNTSLLLEDYPLKLKVICGKNGSGKSTIIEMLKGRADRRKNEYLIVWRDINGHYMSTSSCIIFEGKANKKICVDKVDHGYDSVQQICSIPNHEYEDNPMWRNLIKDYSSRPHLYDDSEKFFDGFRIEIDPRQMDTSNVEDSLQSRFPDNDRVFVDRSVIYDHPVLFALTRVMCDNTFDEYIQNLITEKGISTYKELCEYFQTDDLKKLEKETKRMVYSVSEVGNEDGDEIDLKIPSLDPLYKYYSITELDEMLLKVEELSNKFDEIVRIFVESCHDKYFHVQNGALNDILWFVPCRQMSESIYIGLNDLSDGELKRILQRFRLVRMLSLGSVAWLYFDEPEVGLHPEWCRQYLKEFLDLYMSTEEKIIQWNSNLEGRCLSVVIVTHSPFLLSDLTPDYLIQLKKTDDGRFQVDSFKESTFCGNIGDILHDGFFMNKTIGEFARHKIENTLELLDSKSLNPEDKKKAECLFNQVSDPLLRKLLLERIL